MTQRDLFERFVEPLAAPEPCDPHVAEADKPRLSGQCAAILALLRAGPRTNAELAAVSLKYTSRLSDLRAAGYEITCQRLEGGVTLYRLGGRIDGTKPNY
jgi:hypothetical protein